MTWGATLLGCQRGRETEKALADAAQSYDRLKPGLARVRSVLGEVHKGADELSTRVPGGPAWRGKVLALDEVVGVLDAKIKWWLPGELEAAKKARNQEQASKVRDDIALAAREIDQAGKTALDLAHEKARLQRQAALLGPAAPKVEAEKREPARRARRRRP